MNGGLLHEIFSVVMETLLEMLPCEEHGDRPTFTRTQICVKLSNDVCGGCHATRCTH